MFTSGYLGTMMGGGTAGQEKVAIEAVEADSATSTVTAWAKSTGGGPVNITEAILKDSAGLVEQVDSAVDIPLDAAGTLTGVNCTFTMVAGDLYTVTLVSKEGNQFVSPTFKAE